jgi:multiple sugar transport system ATP-binding protein
MVFQTYALYPHMTVAQNLSFPLRVAKVPRDQISRRIGEVATLLGLNEFLERKPAQLSGGQRQRVAMGRAIVRQPQAFLMDEPLSNLDAKLRSQMRDELFRLQRELGVTTMYVTHDQAEAMVLGHRIVVLRDGQLQQLGTPKDVYNRPANLFVAAFVGSPAMNMLFGQIDVDRSTCSVRFGDQRIALDEAEVARQRTANSQNGREVVVGIRPESLLLGASGENRDLSVVVRMVEEIGSDTYVRLALARASAPPKEMVGYTEDLKEDIPDLDLGSEREMTVVGRFEPTVDLKAGDCLTVTLKRGVMCLFESESGKWLE